MGYLGKGVERSVMSMVRGNVKREVGKIHLKEENGNCHSTSALILIN